MTPRSGRRWVVLAALGIAIVAVPAAATDLFADVDTSSVHHDPIMELADAGVTSGCEVGRYCPRDPVSRDQMASFLTRGLSRATSGSSVASLSAANELTGVPASVTVATTGVGGGRGMVTLQGSVSVFADGSVGSCPCEVEAFIYRERDDAQGPSSWAQLPGEASGGGRSVTSLAVNWSVEVPSGSSETFHVAVLINDGDPGGATAEATLTAVTSPLS